MLWQKHGFPPKLVLHNHHCITTHGFDGQLRPNGEQLKHDDVPFDGKYYPFRKLEDIENHSGGDSAILEKSDYAANIKNGKICRVRLIIPENDSAKPRPDNIRVISRNICWTIAKEWKRQVCQSVILIGYC